MKKWGERRKEWEKRGERMNRQKKRIFSRLTENVMKHWMLK